VSLPPLHFLLQLGQASGKRTRLVAQSSRLSYATHWSKKVAI
jgi:hypothetical protein